MASIINRLLGAASTFALNAASMADSTGGPSAPTASNRDFLVFGDSRADDTLTVTPPVAGVSNGTYNVGGYVAWLRALYPHIRFKPDADFGIGGQTTTNMNTVPRPGTVTKGKDYAASNAAANVIAIMGTNDSNGLATSQTQVNGILSTLSSKAIFLLNELPRGKKDDGTVANAAGNPANFKLYQDWLETKDYRVGGGSANVAVVNTWDAHVDAASGTNYYNLRGFSKDGLHPNSESAYTIAGLLKNEIALTHSTVVNYATPYLPTAVDPANPTAGEIASYASRNPFLTGTTGNFFNVNGTKTGTVPTGMYVSAGGSGAPLNVEITYDTDPQGYRRMNMRVTGTLGSDGYGEFRLYEDIGATHLAARGIVPGDTLAAVAMVVVDGIDGGYLGFGTGNSGQLGYYLTGTTSFGLRRGTPFEPLVPASAYTTQLPHHTLDMPTPPGSTWATGNGAGAPRVDVGVNFGALPGGTVIDFTLRVSRMTLFKR